MSVVWFQRELRLPPFPRGFHLITSLVVEGLPEMRQVKVGVLHLFLLHTSASLSINENADPDVPLDLEAALARLAPDHAPYRHTIEGPDDMSGHLKTSLLGVSLCVPVREGKLCLGTWQGIYLCEHRNNGGPRRLVLTLQGTVSP